MPQQLNHLLDRTPEGSHAPHTRDDVFDWNTSSFLDDHQQQSLSTVTCSGGTSADEYLFVPSAAESLVSLPEIRTTPPTTTTGSPRTSNPGSVNQITPPMPAEHSPSTTSTSSRSHKIEKRQRNTEAARRYRQRKVDKVTELEEALRDMTKERDELRLKLARAEAEADVLRGMVSKKN